MYLSLGIPSVTFISPRPAKWNVLSVICVDGSPMDWKTKTSVWTAVYNSLSTSPKQYSLTWCLLHIPATIAENTYSLSAPIYQSIAKSPGILSRANTRQAEVLRASSRVQKALAFNCLFRPSNNLFLLAFPKFLMTIEEGNCSLGSKTLLIRRFHFWVTDFWRWCQKKKIEILKSYNFVTFCSS